MFGRGWRLMPRRRLSRAGWSGREVPGPRLNSLPISQAVSRTASSLRLTVTRAYIEAVEANFGSEIDYAMLVKIYGATSKKDETRYSPAECIGCEKKWVAGNPVKELISTSYVER